jgi:hypothetical protein
MAVQVSAAWEKVQRMINRFIALMPNTVLALFVFAIFFRLLELSAGLSKG